MWGILVGSLEPCYFPHTTTILDLSSLTMDICILPITQLQHTVTNPITSFSYFGRKYFSVGSYKDSKILSVGCTEPIGDAGILVLTSNGM